MEFNGGAVATGIGLGLAGALFVSLYVLANRRARGRGQLAAWGAGWLLAAPGMALMGAGWALLCLSGPRVKIPGGLLAGVLLCLAGAAIYAASALRVGRLRSPSRYSLALYTGGIYRCVRHPQALALCLAAVGVGLATSSVPYLLSLPLWLGFWTAYTYLEEHYELIPTFGEEYVRYRQTTPRLLPIKLARRREGRR